MSELLKKLWLDKFEDWETIESGQLWRCMDSDFSLLEICEDDSEGEAAGTYVVVGDIVLIVSTTTKRAGSYWSPKKVLYNEKVFETDCTAACWGNYFERVGHED